MTQSTVGQTTTGLKNSGGYPWARRYAWRLVATDFLVIVWAVYGSQFAWFGLSREQAYFGGSLRDFTIGYGTVSVILILAWMVSLSISGTRDSRVVGSGSVEYKRVFDGTFRLFGLFAIVVYLFKIDVARGYIIIAFPLGLAVLCATRWLWRQWLVMQRARGEYSAGVLLAGSLETVTHLAHQLASQPEAGYRVLGACVPTGVVADYLAGLKVPVVGNMDRVAAAMQASGADTLVVTSSDELSPAKLRALSWSLEPGRQHLIVAPALTDIGGPRIHTRPVAGLPLIHVETPRYEGGKKVLKRAFDLVGSSLLLLLLSVPLLLIAAIVRLGTPGSVLFRQERVGLNGEIFLMLKFRSMVTDAEDRLSDLLEQERAEGNAILFKMKDDPRVTPFGRILRRYSLDELPQLINVFRGEMSLVGPRPPVQREVELYEKHVNRRFLVKPGVTGLWQVSGRSNLSWEDSVRLDLYYVENWSMTADILILFRTLRAVVARDGAY